MQLQKQKKTFLIYTRTAIVFIYTTLPLLQKQTKQTNFSIISKKNNNLVIKCITQSNLNIFFLNNIFNER